MCACVRVAGSALGEAHHHLGFGADGKRTELDRAQQLGLQQIKAAAAVQQAAVARDEAALGASAQSTLGSEYGQVDGAHVCFQCLC